MKTILITGTSRGIGLELCLLLAKNPDHKIIALSRKKAEELSQFDNIEYFSIDLTNPNDLATFTQQIKKQYNQIDVLIHNAGAIVNKVFAEVSMDEFEYIYKVNVFGVAALTQAVLPLMPKGSHVVTISSMGGIQGSMKFPGLAAYSSSKGAVITLSELLAEEYKEQGVSFNVLALGAVQTEMLQEAFPGYQAPLTPNNMASYIADFALTGNLYFNGKVLQVSSTTP